MRHRKKGYTLDRKAGPRKALLVSLACALIEHGRITTTHARAKAVQPLVERSVTMAKTPTLAHHRLLVARLGGNRACADSLLKTIAPQFAKRPGGYTRIFRLTQRKGDGAPMSVIAWTEVVGAPAKTV